MFSGCVILKNEDEVTTCEGLRTLYILATVTVREMKLIFTGS